MGYTSSAPPQDCLANARAYGAGLVWLTYAIRDVAQGQPPVLEVDIFNNVPDDNRTLLTKEMVDSFFEGTSTNRSANSTRIGLPSARRIMVAIGEAWTCTLLEMSMPNSYSKRLLALRRKY